MAASWKRSAVVAEIFSIMTRSDGPLLVPSAVVRMWYWRRRGGAGGGIEEDLEREVGGGDSGGGDGVEGEAGFGGKGFLVAAG